MCGRPPCAYAGDSSLRRTLGTLGKYKFEINERFRFFGELMKQKVVAKAIIKRDGKVLLLRRKGGRPSIDGLYELPGGRIHINQQPEDSLHRSLATHIGVAAETVQLSDVMTYIDPDDRALQYVFIIYSVGISSYERVLYLSQEYSKYEWKEMSKIQLNNLTQSTQQLLGIAPVSYDTYHNETSQDEYGVDNTANATVVVYTDGGSRGNPGPSASGYVIMEKSGKIINEGGAYLGTTTNNVAEYQAVYLALEKVLELGARVVDMRMDSQLVANQMNGIYKVKHETLSGIRRSILELASQFDKVSYTYVAREHNKLADGMVNKILDEHLN